MGSLMQPSFSRKPLPVFPGLFAALGPGIVWMAFAQGSGELIWWPYLIAKYGLFFLWMMIPAALLQYPLTYEIGRYTLLTGEGIWTGLIRLNRLFAFLLWILMLVGFLWFGAYAAAGGTAFAALTHFPPGWSARGQSLFWGYLTIAFFVWTLLSGRNVYRKIERGMWVIAVVTVVGLVYACFHPTVVSLIPEFLRGLVGPFGPAVRPWEEGDAPMLVSAITFMGLGGFYNLFYSYWIREKGSGMASYRDPEGIVPEEDPRGEGRKWLRFLRIDAGVGIAGNILTTLMTCLLAYAVLFPQGVFPKDWQIAVVQAEFFGLQWGDVGRMIFLTVAAAFLADGWLTTVDGVSRVNTDVIYHLFPRSRARSEKWWYRLFVVIFTAITSVTMLLAQPGSLILLGGVIGFVAMGIYPIALWILNNRRLPASIRPSMISKLLLGVASLVYLILLGLFLWVKFG